MARNLSWIDPEKLASLLDVVSPAPRRIAGEDPSEATIDSALFAATYTNEAVREEPAPRPTPTRPAAVPAPRPAAAAPVPPRRPAAAEPAAPVPPRRPAAAEPATSVPPRPPAAAEPAAPVPPRRPAAPAPEPATAARPAPAPAATLPDRPSTPAAAAAPAPRLPALVAFQPDPRADLAVRLEAFLDWVVSTTRSQGALITDANGLVVVERRANEVEACMTASIDLMLNHVADVVQSDLDGYVTLHRDGLHLVTLWTPSEYGRFFGVLIGETSPPQESIALAGQGLRTLFAN